MFGPTNLKKKNLNAFLIPDKTIRFINRTISQSVQRYTTKVFVWRKTKQYWNDWIELILKIWIFPFVSFE